MFKVLTLNVDTFRKKGASCKGEGFWLKNYPPSRPTPFSAPPPQVVNINQNQKSRPKNDLVK